MVLEEASSSSADAPFAPEPTPFSDADPYSTNPSSTRTLRIDIDHYPSAPPILGSLLGHTRARLESTVNRGIAAQSQLLRRPPTQDEAEALAYNLCYSDAAIFYGGAAGLLFALFLMRRGRAVFRFPFVTPSPEWFNPNKLGPLNGDRAKIGWHVLRFTAYSTGGYALGSLLGSSYAAVHFAKNLKNDPRLKEFGQAMEEYSRRRQGGVSQQQRPVPQPRPMQEQKQGRWDDDMSPQASNYGSGDTGVLSDDQMQSQERGQGTVPRWGPAESSGGSYDEPSPTAGAPGESSWDRIRREASSGGSPQSSGGRWSPQQQATPSNQGDGSTRSDSFSFSSSEEDRQLARSEAQKEFDARVERERQGKDFNDASKNWR